MAVVVAGISAIANIYGFLYLIKRNISLEANNGSLNQENRVLKVNEGIFKKERLIIKGLWSGS